MKTQACRVQRGRLRSLMVLLVSQMIHDRHLQSVLPWLKTKDRQHQRSLTT